MATDEKARMDQLKKIEIYPYSERGNPQPLGFIRPEGKKWIAAHPRVMKYWERLADAINREPVFERDRFLCVYLHGARSAERARSKLDSYCTR